MPDLTFLSPNYRNRQGVAKNADDIAHLKRMCEELNQKSQFDEKRVSDMNVNVENMHMNLSLNHRTVLGLVEDRETSTVDDPVPVEVEA